ncbi:pikAI, partial [Symbiodinium sp. CCMP2456]
MHLFLECAVCLVGWDHQPYFSEENQQGKTYARHGGFIEGAELFDLTYFGLGTAEAKTTDPQQRLLLNAAYDALHADGYDKGLLQNAAMAPWPEDATACAKGVFAALSNLDWYQLALPQAGVYTGPGVSCGMAANRISVPAAERTKQYRWMRCLPYLLCISRLRLRPHRAEYDSPRLTSVEEAMHVGLVMNSACSAEIDTACSSSISALHAALRSLEVMVASIHCTECSQPLNRMRDFHEQSFWQIV